MPRRFESSPGVWWTWAWIVILISGALTLAVSTPRWTLVIGYGLGTLYPALLLAGALAYAGRYVPRGLLPGAFLIGAVRGLAQLAGLPALAHGAALALEPALALAAAAVVRRATRPSEASLAQRVLCPALVAMAGLDAATAVAMLPRGSLPSALLGFWIVGGPLLLALQLAAWGERSRREFERARELLERRVAEQTERYRTVSELSSDYSFLIHLGPDRRVRTEWVTEAFGRITGYAPEELEGLGWVAHIHPEDRARVVEQMDATLAGDLEIESLEIRVITKAGEERWLNFRFGTARDAEDGSVRVVGTARDVTEQVRAEQERRRIDLHLRETQRLESLGRLAAGIAHDFNNVLTVILGSSELALEDLGRGTLDPRRLQRIRSAAQYAAGLADQILTYSGKAAVALEPLDLSILVGEMRDLLRASLAEKGVLETDLMQGIPAIEGDVTQMRQILLNLVANASEALDEEGGVVRVRTGARHVAEDELAEVFGAPDARPGHYVFLEVSDTGEGLDPATRARIFEPFYTTRSSGRGRGLATVLGIVRAHRGVIRILSDPGRGTAFQILLPRSARRALGQAQPVDSAAPGRRGEMVLLVDDDEAVLEVAGEFLSRAGFEVCTAPGGRAAVELLRDRSAEIDAVILDLVMPDLSGEQTFLALRELRPDLPVVLASGYGREQAAERFSALGIAGFLRKPYEPEDLVRSVRGALAGLRAPRPRAAEHRR